MFLSNGELISCTDVTYNSSFSMSGNSKMVVNGTLYANGVSAFYSIWGMDPYITSGRIEIKQDLIINESSDDNRVFYMSGDSVLFFSEGNHIINNNDVSRIEKLEMTEESIVDLQGDCLLTVDDLISSFKASATGSLDT